MLWLDIKEVTTLANTEMAYVKNRINKLEKDFAAFASLLIQAGIVEVKEEDGVQVYAVNKVKLDG
jgi:predicted transcriptional regulator with HTH domain